MNSQNIKPIEILLAEDNAGDVRLTREALRDARVHNHMETVADGIEALAYLKHEGKYADTVRPDLILLDLNLPRMNGFELLQIIKTDEDLRLIPVVVLTTSKAEEDIVKSYDLHANAYVTKPVDLEQFIHVIRSIEDFWLQIVRLPDRDTTNNASAVNQHG